MTPAFFNRINNDFIAGKLIDCLNQLVNAKVTSEEADLLAVDSATRSRSSPGCLTWFESLTEVDGMVDTFFHAHPMARGRYTCWEQYTNRRYENEGSRIDYILVDSRLIAVNFDEPPLVDSRFKKVRDPGNDQDSEAASLSACTGGGLWTQAPFDGGGIQQGVGDDAQFYRPHTGMIYTPPSYSDHIAVSAVISKSSLKSISNLQRDKRTRRAQPHKEQPTLLSFVRQKFDDNAVVRTRITSSIFHPTSKHDSLSIDRIKVSSVAKSVISSSLGNASEVSTDILLENQAVEVAHKYDAVDKVSTGVVLSLLLLVRRLSFKCRVTI